MIRYRLDDLGWYQFEHLVQSLIKAQFGGGIESWGGRGDWGIDAYYEGEINYPAKDIQNEGLFIFQIKFVENANASGAKPDIALTKAVKAEIYRLKNTPTYSWIEDVNHYVFITNAPLSSKLKSEVKELFKEVFPNSIVHTHGGRDVCDWLDNNPQIYKSFPQLLSIRDLDQVLTEIVNKHIITRSKTVIEGAREIAAVFVPTETYRKSWETLKNHKFVVLDGPAEVGKTAIANMMALTLVLDRWEAVYCAKPEDILQVFKHR
ncbi:MAG: hypothetical protein HY279_13960, partial [Nitrospinae bacterium]|nr:hypothetical protein [Nitrospinota bacterium]